MPSPLTVFVSALLALPLAAHAGTQSFFVPFQGAGNVSVFDSSSGGWVGESDQIGPPVASHPLALVPVVLFSIDSLSQAVSGSFEFDTTDLASTLTGTLGGYADPGFLAGGGKLSLQYSISGGTGAFAGASGIGLSFLNYDPAGSFNNYSESGILSFSAPSPVPEPASLALFAAGVLVVGLRWRKARPLN